MFADIDLHIANCTIALRFPAQRPYLLNELYQQVRYYFKPFLTIRKGQRLHPNGVIDLTKNLDQQPILQYKNNDYYHLFFRQKSHDYIEAVPTLHILQLNIIIKQLLTSLLAQNGSFLVHASACLTPQGALVFCGPSGKGKSTLMTLLSHRFKPLADDALILQHKNGEYTCYQTPFLEKNYITHKKPNAYKIAFVLFPVQSVHTHISYARTMLVLEKLFLKNVVFDTFNSKLTLHHATTFVQSRPHLFAKLFFTRNSSTIMRTVEQLLK